MISAGSTSARGTRGWNSDLFKTVLVTGGAGSLGSALVKTLLEETGAIVRVFDGDDYKLAKLKREMDNPRLRCLLGDVRHFRRLEMAAKEVDVVFHLAAIKHVDIAEYNPIETIRVNVDGLMNIVEVCLRTIPKKMMFISSDKACGFTSLYGATKFLGEKIMGWAHQVTHPGIVFSSIRPGNIMESRGNVFEIWDEQIRRGEPLTVTNPGARRYMIHVDDAARLILRCAEIAEGGEIFVPDMEEYSILELAKGYKRPIEITELKPGEKLAESLMTEDEMKRAVKVENIWVIRP